MTDRPPRKIVGTNAFKNLGDIKSKILEKLKIRVETYALNHPDGRVLVFEIPSRPVAHPMALNGISTLSTKAARKIAKISLDVVERQLVGTNVFRVLNNYIGSVSPAISRPWQPAVLAIDGGLAAAIFTLIIDGGNAGSTGDLVDGGNSSTVF